MCGRKVTDEVQLEETMRKTRPLLSEDALVERWRRRGMEGKQTRVVLGPSYPDGAGTDETQQSRTNK